MKNPELYQRLMDYEKSTDGFILAAQTLRHFSGDCSKAIDSMLLCFPDRMFTSNNPEYWTRVDAWTFYLHALEALYLLNSCLD